VALAPVPAFVMRPAEEIVSFEEYEERPPRGEAAPSYGTTAVLAPESPRAALVDEESPVRAATLAALRNLQQLPALQSLAQGFVAATAKGDGAVDEVVEAVQKDPALCVRVLRLANSAEIRPELPIEDVFTAVQMLGLRRVSTLQHALFTLRDAQVLVDGLDWRHLWLHSLSTASLAEKLEEQLGLTPSPQLYLAALMHDVGKIVLATVLPERYRTVIARVWMLGGRLEETELQVLGVSHREAGRIFAAQVGLSAEVLAAIAHHDAPGQATEFRRSVAIVQVANYLAKLHGLGFAGARLDEVDGEVGDLAAWDILAEELGYRPDWTLLAPALEAEAHHLKSELQHLRVAT
jgi:putative nucleotidyltransferase with HDIG domain